MIPLQEGFPATIIDLLDASTELDEDRQLTSEQRKKYSRFRKNFGLDNDTQREKYGLDSLDDDEGTASTSQKS